MDKMKWAYQHFTRKGKEKTKEEAALYRELKAKLTDAVARILEEHGVHVHGDIETWKQATTLLSDILKNGDAKYTDFISAWIDLKGKDEKECAVIKNTENHIVPVFLNEEYVDKYLQFYEWRTGKKIEFN